MGEILWSIKMTDLIIRCSYSELENKQLKSNLGDVVRTSVLLSCIDSDFLWLTDKRSYGLLKYFVDPEKILFFSEENLDIALKRNFSNIYNVDNYVADKRMLLIKGQWKGYIPSDNGVMPENEIMEAMQLYIPKLKISWQQALVEGMGFKWKEQDYSLIKVSHKIESDIGLNWHVQQDWNSKKWSENNWKELASLLEKNYAVSWQKGMNNLDEYISWIASCKAVVTCETLGLHLASALRKKVIGLVGPMTNNEYPYDRLTLIKPSPRICMPCDSLNCSLENNCMNDIYPYKVNDTILKILKE